LVELLTITVQIFFWFVDLSLMVTNYSNINKPKESLSNRDGKQFLQYQQNKRKFIKQRWSTILPISSTITVKTFFWFVDIG
jgi:hypothetical protein